MMDTKQPAVHIRHAEPADVAQWAAMRSVLWPDEPAAELAAAASDFFSRPRTGPGVVPEAVLVAVGADASVLVGFAEVSRRLYAEGCETSPVGFLEGWYVTPAYRRRGVGRALVLAAETWARQQGCREFASDALVENLESAAAHHALGFEEVEVIRCFRKSLDPGLSSDLP